MSMGPSNACPLSPTIGVVTVLSQVKLSHTGVRNSFQEWDHSSYSFYRTLPYPSHWRWWVETMGAVNMERDHILGTLWIQPEEFKRRQLGNKLLSTFSCILCAFVVIFKEAQEQHLKAPSEASSHRQEEAWCTVINNDITSVKQVVLGHLESRRTLLFQPRQVLRSLNNNNVITFFSADMNVPSNSTFVKKEYEEMIPGSKQKEVVFSFHSY